jgi:prepilin signal peptidase PulO-like enzyme (type II secretory pathway)
MFHAAFFVVLLLASVIDIKTHTVPVPVYMLVILIGLYHPTLSALEGLVITFIPLLITGLLFPTRFGGGDIKFGALCGFILTGTKGLIALFLGAILCLFLVPILLKLLHKSMKNTEIPLLPFLSIGCVIASLI